MSSPKLSKSSGTIITRHKWVFPKIGVFPKSSILIGFSLVNHPFWGKTPILGNTQMFPSENPPKLQNFSLFTSSEKKNFYNGQVELQVGVRVYGVMCISSYVCVWWFPKMLVITQLAHGKMISTWGVKWGYHHLRKHPSMWYIVCLFPQITPQSKNDWPWLTQNFTTVFKGLIWIY